MRKWKNPLLPHWNIGETTRNEQNIFFSPNQLCFIPLESVQRDEANGIKHSWFWEKKIFFSFLGFSPVTHSLYEVNVDFRNPFFADISWHGCRIGKLMAPSCSARQFASFKPYLLFWIFLSLRTTCETRGLVKTDENFFSLQINFSLYHWLRLSALIPVV